MAPLGADRRAMAGLAPLRPEDCAADEMLAMLRTREAHLEAQLRVVDGMLANLAP